MYVYIKVLLFIWKTITGLLEQEYEMTPEVIDICVQFKMCTQISWIIEVLIRYRKVLLNRYLRKILDKESLI